MGGGEASQVCSWGLPPTGQLYSPPTGAHPQVAVGGAGGSLQ